jgi:hypothetical protein
MASNGERKKVTSRITPRKFALASGKTKWRENGTRKMIGQAIF